MARIGRYVLHSPIASGGMATVYFGRALGPVGFRRIVAIKRMHPHLAQDPEFVAMFLDEASLAARIQHPNVVATVDVVAEAGEVAIVMEYIRGESLAGLIRASRKKKVATPIDVAVSLLVGSLNGLHAAHEARGDDGTLLGIIHRDVSPPNILVGLDGMPRLVDFGVAKAASRLDVTREGQFKGKIGYAAPEQLIRSARKGVGAIDRRVDIFAAASLLWELLAGTRLFQGDDDYHTMGLVMRAEIPPLAPHRPEVPPALEAVIRKALARDPDQRYATAEEFALALEAASPASSPRAVIDWLKSLVSDTLAHRDTQVKELETSTNAPSAPEGKRKLATELADASRAQGVGDGDDEEIEDPTDAGLGAPERDASAALPTGAGPTSRLRPARLPVLIGAGVVLGLVVLLVALVGRDGPRAGAAAASSGAAALASAPSLEPSVTPTATVASAPSAVEPPATAQPTASASAPPNGRFPSPAGTWHPVPTKKPGKAYLPEGL
jgi:serine/threonine-protein kinase